jgi:hypothetical protein
MRHADEFHTETMAGLYLKQGYIDRAAEIYQYLLQKNPQRYDLKKALDILEGRKRDSGSRSAQSFEDLIYQWVDVIFRLKRARQLEALRKRRT